MIERRMENSRFSFGPWIPRSLIGAPLAALNIVLLLLWGCNADKPPEPKKTIYTLTVNLGEGVDGYPKAGAYAYDPGMSVDYGYRVLDGYSDLSITLDGQAVAASGSIVMNSNRTLAGACFKRVLWRYHVGNAVYYSCPAVGDDGTVYFGSGMGNVKPCALHALGPDGALKWSYVTGNYSLYSPVIGNDGTIYIQDYQNKVYAVSPGGALRWTYSDYQHVYPHNVGQRNPAVGADGTVYVPADDGIHAVHPQTGQRIWRFQHPTYPGRECLASPVVGANGMIYVTIGEDMLFALNPNGSLRWVLSFANDFEMSFACPAIDQSGVVYLGVEGTGYDKSIHSNVYAVNPDGTLRWKYPLDGSRLVRASIAVAPNGDLYVATKAGGTDETSKLIALSPAGQKVWEYTVDRVHQTPDDIYSSPSVGADGLIYFGAETGFLYAVNPGGTLSWKFDLKAGLNWSSPAIADNGTIYIGGLEGDYEGCLLAVKSTSLGYASTPWPRFRHDRKNTGRYGAW